MSRSGAGEVSARALARSRRAVVSILGADDSDRPGFDHPRLDHERFENPRFDHPRLRNATPQAAKSQIKDDKP